MTADELRDRLAAIDPAHDVATEPPTTSSSRSRLERIMHTDPNVTTDRPSTPGAARRPLLLAAAAAVAVAVAGGVVLTRGGDESPVASGPPVELTLGASDAMASCLPVDAEILADMPVAFAGTATAVEGDTVTLTVEEWYAGGDAGTVVIHAQSGMEALIDGFTFAEGEAYLVSAAEGTVSFCGFSGPATDELRAVYDEAFRS
ncbi:MAG TPA: hypothetical protein VNT54_09420 [Solirubrobacteraceae bacterium]|nr:hypothetical protein [Acidimicrobiales bacterium]HWI07721.1 hypothetical protein [Solirubrobacteraceae bacterium]